MNLAKSSSLAIIALLLMFGASQAAAQLSLAIVFSSDLAGIMLGASGTPNATIPLGTVSAYGGTVPTGVTRTVNGVSSWTLSTPIDVEVIGLGIIVPTFTLTAKMNVADAVNTWKINSANLTSGSASTVTTTGTYNVNTPYTFSLTIPFSEAAGLISNTIDFAATAN
jgi:hypothetical protein